MVIAPLSLQKDYWHNFEVNEKDIEFLYNFLLEIEKPQNVDELLQAIVKERIKEETTALKKMQQSGGTVYYPKEHYQIGQTIQVPAFGWQSVKVISTRPGQNPEVPSLEVIEVELENGEHRLLAAGLSEHKLNQPVSINSNDPLLDIHYVMKQFGPQLRNRLEEKLTANPDLVRVGLQWFPRALIVDINIGHLNLAEAVLDMNGGGPLPPSALIKEIDLPEDVDPQLNEFSLNLALQDDKRFDEVGAAGEVNWFLHRLEPDGVRETPLHLRSILPSNTISDEIVDMLREFDPQILDELEPELHPAEEGSVNKVEISLIYPHWRAGTLPLVGNLQKVFPTAYESPRVQFTFVDGNSGEKFSGWVVRPNRYIYGLREWYTAQGLVTGSVIRIQRGNQPGEVIIQADRKRASKEWLRTAGINSDGSITYSTQKHNISAAVDERLAIMVPDVQAMDKLWEQSSRQRLSLAQIVRMTMKEMAKLSPQNHVHAEELYAGVNLVRRLPPGPILKLLLESPWAQHLGNLYFRLDDTGGVNE
jgi:hypothetical protein